MINNFLRMTPLDVRSGSTYNLLESWGDVNSVDGNRLDESTSNIISLPNMNKLNFKPNEKYITGVFMQADIVNGNKRVYPRRVLDSAINEYMENRVRKGRALGEWNHPSDRVEVNHTEAVLLIEDLWWEGNNVMGKAIISTGDYAEGDKIASLLRIGWRPAVSSRGVGRLIGDMRKDGYMTVDTYRISVGIDIVYDPSAPDAHVDVVGFEESNSNIQESLTINNTRRLQEGVDNNINTLIENLKAYGNS